MIDNESIVFETADASLLDIGNKIGRVLFRTKGNSLPPSVFAFLDHVLQKDLFSFEGIVIVNEGKNFSVGADLNSIKASIDAEEYTDDTILNPFQIALHTIKGYHKPIVAAPFKNVLGGGMELCMHCHARVAAQKTYMGLVEVGVGLLPAGGGLKECALKISQASENEHDQLMLDLFEALLLRTVSANAQAAKTLHFLAPTDSIVEDDTPQTLLAEAKRICLGMVQGFKPTDVEKKMTFGGKRDYDKLMDHGAKMLEKGDISPYDLEIGKRIARVLSGSDSDNDVRLSERELFILENEGMRNLQMQEGTYQRISHFLSTGKMLRN